MSEHLFLHYGAGHNLFAPIKRMRNWNTLLWFTIAFGVIGWLLLFLWLGKFHDYSSVE